MNPSSWFFHAASVLAFLWLAAEALRLRRALHELEEAVLPALCGSKPSRSQSVRLSAWLRRELQARLAVKSVRIDAPADVAPEAWRLLLRLAQGRPEPDDAFVEGERMVPAQELGALVRGRSLGLRPAAAGGAGETLWRMELS